MQPDPRVGPVQPLSRTASVALRYWNISRQRQYRPSARCCRALRVSADHAPLRQSAHPRKTRALPPTEGETRRDTDCLLEGTGFEISVPRYRRWSRGPPKYAIRAERVAWEFV